MHLYLAYELVDRCKAYYILILKIIIFYVFKIKLDSIINIFVFVYTFYNLWFIGVSTRKYPTTIKKKWERSSAVASQLAIVSGIGIRYVKNKNNNFINS